MSNAAYSYEKLNAGVIANLRRLCLSWTRYSTHLAFFAPINRLSVTASFDTHHCQTSKHILWENGLSRICTWCLGGPPSSRGPRFFDTAETLGTDRHLKGPHSFPCLTLRPQRDSATWTVSPSATSNWRQHSLFKFELYDYPPTASLSAQPLPSHRRRKASLRGTFDLRSIAAGSDTLLKSGYICDLFQSTLLREFLRKRPEDTLDWRASHNTSWLQFGSQPQQMTARDGGWILCLFWQ